SSSRTPPSTIGSGSSRSRRATSTSTSSQVARRQIVSVLCALVAVAGLSAYAGAQMAGTPKPVVRAALAQDVDPAGGKGRTLGLSRVDVPSGAKLPLHRHPGTQIARIDRGVLTYTVVTG